MVMNVILLIVTCSLGTVLGTLCYSGWHWEGWSACSQSCGGGMNYRTCLVDGSVENERCGTTCFHGGEFYGGQCHCVPGTHGSCCDDILECASNPCKNGGTCIEGINHYMCRCPAGTTGTNCDDILECNSSPCKNGGTCVEYVNFYACECPLGTTGTNCDDILECLSVPCQNNGTCIEHVGGYTCQCVTGTTGTNCVDIPECASNPCQNGATCVEMINRYQCNCTRDFTGVHCEKNLFWPHETICRTDNNPSCYVMFKVKESWQGAKEFCEAREGHLVVPDDMVEELFLENHLESTRTLFSEALFWIGGTKSGRSPPHWLNGLQSSVFRWPFGVTEDVPGTGCLVMDGDYGFKWQALSCDRPTYFICEERALFQVLG